MAEKEKADKKTKADKADKKETKTEQVADQKEKTESKQSKIKLKGKNWYTVLAPKLFGEKPVGETIAREDVEIMGRKVDVGIPEVTGDMGKYYMKAVFEVDRVETGRAYTRFSELEILKDYISRMVQRRVRRIDSIDIGKTKDGVTVVVKTVGISIRRINNSMKSLVRKEIKNMVLDHISKHTLDQLIMNIIGNRLQVTTRKSASKAYPLRAMEVRRLQVLEYPADYKQDAPATVEEPQPAAQ